MGIIAVSGPVSTRDAALVKAVVAGIVPEMRAYIEELDAARTEQIKTLTARCKALEEAAAKPVEFDLTGMVTRSEVERLIADEIAKIEPAKEIDREELSTLVNDAVAALPPAQDGKSIEIEDVLPAIAAEVARAFEAYPVPKDGEPGKDGRGVKDLIIDRDGQLVATMDDGEMKTLGTVIGKDGKDGEPGRDGFSLDDFDCVPIDERTIKMEFVRGETKHSYELQFPVVVYRGVYKEGEAYERGDTVTWGGSLWHCDTPTKEKPGTESWTLAAKKGRDGKDAKPNG